MSNQLVTIRIREPFLHDGARYEAGEVRKVSERLALYFCGLGWAEDVAGAIETGERVPGAKQINPDDIKLEVGGNG